MTASAAAAALIHGAEGFAAKAYWDKTAKKWTVGYGHTATAKEGMTVTRDEALRLFQQDIAAKEACIERNLINKGVPLTQNQFDALVSLCYNMGCAGFLKTDVAKALQKTPADYRAAEAAFAKYNKSNGITLNGLTVRRRAEAALFAGASAPPPDATKVALYRKTTPETAAKADAGVPVWVWYAAGGVAAVGGGIWYWKKQ